MCYTLHWSADEDRDFQQKLIVSVSLDLSAEMSDFLLAPHYNNSLECKIGNFCVSSPRPYIVNSLYKNYNSNKVKNSDLINAVNATNGKVSLCLSAFIQHLFTSNGRLEE